MALVMSDIRSEHAELLADGGEGFSAGSEVAVGVRG
jgi:hypothetical protein